tara:strand:+ start:61 stop:219 length:159 start_codon:yes stop_codon:yes gene_type:complete
MKEEGRDNNMFLAVLTQLIVCGIMIFCLNQIFKGDKWYQNKCKNTRNCNGSD